MLSAKQAVLLKSFTELCHFYTHTHTHTCNIMDVSLLQRVFKLIPVEADILDPCSCNFGHRDGIKDKLPL